MLAKRIFATVTLILMIGANGALSQGLLYPADLFLDTNRDWVQVQAEVMRERLYLRDVYTRDMDRVNKKQERDMIRLQGREDRDARKRARFHAKAERARIREAYQYRRQLLQDKVTWARREHVLRRKYASSAYLITDRKKLGLEPVAPTAPSIALSR